MIYRLLYGSVAAKELGSGVPKIGKVSVISGSLRLVQPACKSFMLLHGAEA